MKRTILRYHILVMTLVVLGTSALQAQDAKSKREQLDAMKIGFITQKLNLGTKEAQIFWPVYNEFQQAIKKLKHEQKQKRLSFRGNLNELSDAEMEKLVDTHLDDEQRLLNIRKEYHLKFKQVLPIRKVAKLYKAEQEFKRKLLEQLKKRAASG